jgi:hypothetical protein
MSLEGSGRLLAAQGDLQLQVKREKVHNIIMLICGPHLGELRVDQELQELQSQMKQTGYEIRMFNHDSALTFAKLPQFREVAIAHFICHGSKKKKLYWRSFDSSSSMVEIFRMLSVPCYFFNACFSRCGCNGEFSSRGPLSRV